MMKHFFLSIFCLSMFIVNIHAQRLNIATYNLRYDNAGDSLDRWVNRCPNVAGLVQLYDFDIFGTQEGLHNQLEDLKKGLPGYEYIGVGRDDGISQGEHSAIFYKKGKFSLTDKGNFWLSTVTDKPNKGWDAACVRICTWGKFIDKASGFTFYMFNVHFDHKGEVARRESAKLILKKMKDIAGENQVILTGDFNFNEKHEVYASINSSGYIRDAYGIAAFKYAPNATFNEFNINNQSEGRIDHIFVSGKFKAERYGILTNTYYGRFPSDHFPVLAVIAY